MNNLTHELEIALKLALDAGALALDYNRGKFSVQEKPGDLGPVTEADLASSRLIVDGLRKAFPQDGILSEEEEPDFSAGASRFWCIDPIDGTKDFIQKNGEWSVLIGLVENEVPILGVIYQPDRGKLWSARRGAGAWLATADEAREGKSGKRISARSKGQGNPLIVLSRNHPDAESEVLAKRLGIEQKMIHGSVGIKLALIADGTGDFYTNSSGKTSLWDLCAGDALLREAGGRLLVRDGREAPLHPLDYRPDQIQVTEQVFAMGRGWESDFNLL